MRQILFFLFVIGLAVAAIRFTDAHRSEADVGGVPSGVPANAPPEIAGIVSSVDQARADGISSVTGGLLRKKADEAPVAASDVAVPFANAGSPRRIRAVRHAVRRGLRASSAKGERLHVMAWQGVIVVGHRAAVRADVERIVRTRSGRQALPPRRMTLGLLRDNGWKIVSTKD